MDDATYLSDQEIIALILNGNASLFELIIRRYNSYLYKIGRSYNYNHEDTQDLMQDTYMNTFLNLKNFEQRSLFKTWIAKIMINSCFKKKEKINHIKTTINAMKNETPVHQIQEMQQQYQNNIVRKELNYIIENALLEIPLHYRMVFALRAINGFSNKETASLLEISETNVKVRHSRAKLLLRKAVEKNYAPQDLFEFNLIYCDAMVSKTFDSINQLKH